MAGIKITQREKRIHYSQVASGAKPVKAGSKYSEAEQRAYAKGQRDARNEAARITAYKHATPEARAAYKQQKKAKQAAYRAFKSGSCLARPNLK